MSEKHTLDCMACHQEYILCDDIKTLALTDEQVSRAIGKARQCRGEKVITTKGTIERYVKIDGVTVPVMGCKR